MALERRPNQKLEDELSSEEQKKSFGWKESLFHGSPFSDLAEDRFDELVYHVSV